MRMLVDFCGSIFQWRIPKHWLLGSGAEEQKINYLSMARTSTSPGEINFTERWHCQGDSRHSGSKSSVRGLSHIFSLSLHGNGALLLTRQDHLDVVEKKSLSFNCRICLSVVGWRGFNCLSLCHIGSTQRLLYQTVSCNYNFNSPFNSSYTHNYSYRVIIFWTSKISHHLINDLIPRN